MLLSQMRMDGHHSEFPVSTQILRSLLRKLSACLVRIHSQGIEITRARILPEGYFVTGDLRSDRIALT